MSRMRLGRNVRLFLLSALAAFCGSGVASATCTPTLPITAGSVPCYIKVQPIDVGTTLGGSVVYAPFNTTSQIGNPSIKILLVHVCQHCHFYQYTLQLRPPKIHGD